MPALIKSSALSGFPQLVDDLGGDAVALLRKRQIDPLQLQHESAVLPYRSLVDLLEDCATQLRCPDFGLRLAARQGPAILGPLAQVAQSARTVGEALAAITPHLHIYCNGVHVYLDCECDPERPHLIFELRLEHLPRQRQIIEMSLGVMHRVVQALYGPNFQADAVLASTLTRLPQLRYQRFFGTRTYFGQNQNALILRPEHMRKTLAQHDRQLHEELRAYVSRIGSGRPLDLSSQIQHLIRQTLHTHRCTLELIAQRLAMPTRSLQRRLAKEQQAFEDMVEQARRELADTYLAEARMPMAHISTLLGYSEQSSFNRACQRWHGQAPGQRRAAMARSTAT